jgi:DNA-binding response OmpR family regulator
MLLKGKNVLVIEDNENDMKIVENHLKTLKAKVFKSITGEKALKTFKKEKIDLVLIDYRLPYKNGLMISDEIKNIKNVPIILVTGADDVIQDIDYIKKFNFNDIICKPYHKSDLLHSIESV